MTVCPLRLAQLASVPGWPWLCRSCVLLTLIAIPTIGWAQEEDELATIQGQIVMPEDYDGDVQIKDLNIRLVEPFFPKQPPLPDDWSTKSPVEQQQWFQQFLDTDEGKAFQQSEKERFDSRHQFDVDIEAEGKFVIYDVPPGKYLLQGAYLDQESERRLRFEVIGEVTVKEEALQVALQPLMVSVIPIIVRGDSAPEFSIDAMDNKKVDLKAFLGRYVLIHFWTSESEPAVAELKAVSESFSALKKEVKLVVVGVSLDKELGQAVAAIRDAGASWIHCHAKESFETPAVKAFGVRSLPSFWLVNPDGNIEMTDAQVFFRRSGGATFEQLIKERIAGTDAIAEFERRQKEEAAKTKDKSDQ